MDKIMSRSPTKSSKSILKRPLTLSGLILKKIAELGGAAMSGFFPAKYPEARLWRELLGRNDNYEFSRQNFSKLLSKLQSQGLIKHSGFKKGSKWEITSKGKQAIQSLRSSAGIILENDGIRRIVTFDISEKERKKRRWVRLRLLEHEYEQLQKSVWMGNKPLQREFFEELENLRLLKSVHVFSIRGEGTLRSD